MDKAVYAYTAGLLDGEGTVTANFRVSPSTGNPATHCRVMIPNTNRPLCEWLAETFGGAVSRFGKPRKAEHNQVHYWYLGGQPVAPFLRPLLPYLKLKRRQAEIVLALLELRHTYVRPEGVGGRGRWVSPETQARRKVLVEEIQALNFRGVKRDGWKPGRPVTITP